MKQKALDPFNAMLASGPKGPAAAPHFENNYPDVAGQGDFLEVKPPSPKPQGQSDHYEMGTGTDQD